MKKFFLISFLAVVLCITSCNYNTKEKKDSGNVIFLNAIPNLIVDEEILTSNRLDSEYTIDDDEDALYAFVLDYGNAFSKQKSGFLRTNYNDSSADRLLKKKNQWVKKALKLVNDAGLYIISDYPLCHYYQYKYGETVYSHIGLIAVAGTYQQITELFDDTEPINGLCWRVRSAPRPDYFTKMRDAGWDGNLNGEAPEDWAYRNREKMENLVGNENQVTLKVDFETAED